jgi:hypothetical protein
MSEANGAEATTGGTEPAADDCWAPTGHGGGLGG